ncbi:MAG: VOC family protein [Planctomycetota bacterium]|nr:MAG: VOC family protein [Planctomycetota bacterium]
MQATLTTINYLDHIHLRVNNLARSKYFYCNLLGFTPCPTEPTSAVVCILKAPTKDQAPTFSIILTEGLPTGSELTGMDHFSISISTMARVEEIYQKAMEHGFRATKPRLYEGNYQTFIFDPDGYKIEFFTKNPNMIENAIHEEQFIVNK